jgi:hypothetical protein
VEHWRFIVTNVYREAVGSIEQPDYEGGGASLSRAWSARNRRQDRLRPQHVAEALTVLEWAGVPTWQHRITRTRERCTDLFGRESWEWRVHRRSNAYAFRDPLLHTARPSAYNTIEGKP